MGMARVYFLLLLLECFGLFVLLAFNTKNSTLQQVNILFRHGERSPSKTYSNDPHKNHKWPGGWDQLSTRGKLEEFHLGQSLRKLYSIFLSEDYVTDNVLVQSSYADRCIMSAQLLLAGLYPPRNEQIWNPSILWQPIPVHSIPRFIDNKIAIKATCPTYDAALKDIYNSDKIKEVNAANKNLYEYLTKHTGDKIDNIRSLETLYNTLEIEKINNLTLPNWTDSVFPDKMTNLAALSLAVFTETEFMKRMHGGILVKEIIDNMVAKKYGTLKPNRGLFLYSGHDLTVVTLLRVLGFNQLIKPEFGASVIIELHNMQNNYIVKFFYKPNPYVDIQELSLNTCGTVCKLDDLEEILRLVMPTDWDKEC